MPDNLKYLDDENFEASIKKGVTLVDFHADWCGPCKMIAPIIEELSNELLGQALVAKVDVDMSQDVSQKYDITSIPTLIVFKDGQEVKRVVGVRDKNTLKSMVLENL